MCVRIGNPRLTRFVDEVCVLLQFCNVTTTMDDVNFTNGYRHCTNIIILIVKIPF